MTYKVRVPLIVLAEACVEAKPFGCSLTEQRALENAEAHCVCAPHSPVPMD